MQLDILKGIFDSDIVKTITLPKFLLCMGVALVSGLILALLYSYKSNSSKSFLVTLATLPAVVCVIILMVNGNVGTGVAVAGAFSLVRFRSVPGTAKEIGALFIAMGSGLMFGTGYLAYGVIFTIIISLVTMLYNRIRIGESFNALDKTMTVTIPEDLNYTNVFDDIMKQYTVSNKIVKVKTTNLGSLFKITYNLKLKNKADEKDLIDEIRCRNGNLEITVSPLETMTTEL